MKTILEELYDGRIFPAERILSKDPEYHRVNREISDLREFLSKKLSEEDLKFLETFQDLNDQSAVLEAAASFEYGFKLGAWIMLEVLDGKGELVRDGGE